MPAPRKYPDELRERAIREVRTTGRPVAHVAKDLGIHKEALRQWVRQAEADHGERDDRLTTAEHDELRQLRKENAELKRANEILKAASVFLAREPYWAPWSEWNTAPSRPPRVAAAIRSASATKPVRMRPAMDQPTTLRLKQSSTVAR